jgi:hypothetical protein
MKAIKPWKLQRLSEPRLLIGGIVGSLVVGNEDDIILFDLNYLHL